jgi:hypothetical protein
LYSKVNARCEAEGAGGMKAKESGRVSSIRMGADDTKPDLFEVIPPVLSRFYFPAGSVEEKL